MDIRLDNLSIGYGHGAPLASAINAVVHGGELTCVIGRNGTGKSTLLKTLTGFIPAMAGRVVVGGRCLSALSQRERSRTVSVVLTATPDVENVTAGEMVAMGRMPWTGFWGRLSAADRIIVDRAMAMAGVETLADRTTRTLSDGERQKVMIARALAQQTPVMVLDEPTAFLDYTAKAETMSLLRQLAHDEKKAIIMSTHDLGLCVSHADRFLLLDSGSLKEVTKEEVESIIKE
ncbi:ABC transporter ATP-binding protein [Prevotella lacticifex]|nr:ABC transporter ATP-binding protein [Prevotella lacticifex]